MLMVGLYNLSKKGRSSHVLQFTNKLTSEELNVTGTRPLLPNQWYIIYENKCNLFESIRRIPVVTRSYDHEFLKSNSVTNFSHNAMENYGKYQIARVNTNYDLVPYNKGVVMIKKPSAPTLTTQIDFWQITYHKTLHSLMPILPHQEPRNRLLATPCFYCSISF